MGENGAACLPYFPRRIGEGVWVNEITRICRYSLQGAVAEESQLVAFDAKVTPDSLADAKYPIAGAPRGDLALAPPFLYARVGGLVSSRMDDDVLADRLPRAEIVALDISKPSDPRVLFEARCQELGVSGAAPERLEFEGPPVVFGDLLLVPVVERMNVGVSRMIIGLDRYSGQLRWQSQVLGQGVVPGTERASHIGFQQLCVAGGMLFYATNLGTVCCLNPGDGSVQWVVQYVSPSMFMPGSRDDGRPLRFLYRQVNCQCNAGLLYCAPSDCGEVFALDATSGDLVWSTAAGEVPDIKTFVGFAEDSIVYSGDRLVWLDRWTGSVQSVFPGARTPGRLMALHRSRGVGQPALHRGYVYFPTSEEILVFDASQSPGKLTRAQQGEQASASRVGESPARVAEPISRMATGSRGAAGGNLLVDDEVLLMATPSRLHIFRRE
jgi:outer membrane protein assembly factor BamB